MLIKSGSVLKRKKTKTNVKTTDLVYALILQIKKGEPERRGDVLQHHTAQHQSRKTPHLQSLDTCQKEGRRGGDVIQSEGLRV